MSVVSYGYIEQVSSPSALQHVDFIGEQTEITVPGSALHLMPFDVDDPVDADTFETLSSAYRARGYFDAEPIHLWPAANSRWAVDALDVTRYEAILSVATDFFANIITQKVRRVHFVLHAASPDGRHLADRLAFGHGGD